MMSEEERAADTSKGGRSNGEDTTSETGDNKKRCCARCRNHESELVELKGHKNYCPWRDCFCELCLKTVFRQKLMADQTATRRKRVEMERRAKKGLPLIVPTANQAKRLKTAPHNIVPPPEPTPIVSYNPPPRSREVSWEAITELMNIFNFNVNTSCLLYLVLKYISNNVKDARSIILSAKEDIKKISNKTLNGGATPMVQPMFTMNQLEVVPLYVVPSEKVLDLSYQPGLGYPRTPISTQGYPYPRAGTPPPPSQCFGWKQSFRQPNWPNPGQPYDRVPITPYHEVPKDDKERRQNEKDKGSELEHHTPEQESEDKEHEMSVEHENLSEDSDEIEMADNTKEEGKKVTMHPETTIERLTEGASGVKIKDEASHKLNVYRPFQESDKVMGFKKDVYSQKDQFSVYGEHVGNQLRSLTDKHSLTVARYEIDQVIFKAIMGEYYVGSCQCCLQDSSKDTYTPRSSPRSPLAPNSPFQPFRTTVQAPVPIRPQLSVEPWTGVK